MSVPDRLASALGRRDEKPNIELAVDVAVSKDRAAVADLFGILDTGKKPARHDAIKVLYEIAERDPELVAPHLDKAFPLLNEKDNRMLWAALTLIDALTAEKPKSVMTHLDAILDAADRSSVIAKDKTMSILSKLNADPAYAPVVTPVILNRLKHAAVNQFPMYAEFAAATMPDDHIDTLVGIIETRRDAISYPAKKKRLDKLLRYIAKDRR